MSRAFDSTAIDRVQTQKDTKIALVRHLQARLDASSPVMANWGEVSNVSLHIRALARKRTGSALAYLMGCVQDFAGKRDGGGRWEGESALLSPVSDSDQAKASQVAGIQGWIINAEHLQVEGNREVASYTLMAETDTGETAVFLVSRSSPGVEQSSLDGGSVNRLSISLNAVPALHCFPVRAPGDAEPSIVMATLWIASLLCGMTDRLFSMAKALHATLDPRQAAGLKNDSALHRNLARIDALLLTQELALRTMLTFNADGSLDLASARSNSSRVIESAFQASITVVRTLRNTQEVDLLDSIRLQVQAVAVIHHLSSKLVAGASLHPWNHSLTR